MAIIYPRVAGQKEVFSNQFGASRTRAIPYPIVDLSQVFDFNARLTALPEALQRLNATYTRNSEKRVLQNGALVTLAANQFGTGYDDVTGLYGYVPEPAATNLIQNSGLEGPSGAPTGWSAINIGGSGTLSTISVSYNPVGKTIVADAVGSQTYVLRNYVAAESTTYIASAYIVAVTGNLTARAVMNANLSLAPAGTTISFPPCQANPAGGGGSVIGTGWLLMQYVVGGSSGYVQLRVGAGTDGITKVNGSVTFTAPQVESGLSQTSWILTPVASTATRAADVPSVPVANLPGFSAAGYTLFADVRTDMSDGQLRYAIALSDGTSNNYAAITRTAAGLVGAEVVSGGVSQSAVAEISASTARTRVAFSVSANSFLRAVNGVAGTADNSGAMPVAPTTLCIGHINGTNQRNGFLYRVGIIPQALTQAQINALTVL